MKRLTRTFPLLLAAALQLLPLLRNIVTSPAAGSSFAIILRWGIGLAAGLETVDAVSGASNSFSTPTNFSGTVGIPFTNNVTISSYGTDPGAYSTITVGSKTVALTTNGQSTTNGMPPGLTLVFVDKLQKGGLYDAISGTPTNAGVYSFGVSMSFAGFPDVSTAVTITIAAGGTAPSITNQPVSVATNAGSTVTFSVTNGGTAPFTYQWYFNTNTALAKATNAVLTLANVQLTNAGTYSVTIANAAGATNSSFAQLTVWQAPLIGAQPAGTNVIIGSNAVFKVAASGSAPLVYQWAKDTVPLANGGNISGATSNILTVAAVGTNDAGNYSVTITNAYGTSTSSNAALAILLPPAITGQPISLTNAVNDSVNFSVTATGTAPLNFKWLKNSSPITNGVKYAGVNSNVLSVLNLLGPDAGTYSVVVTNLAGSVTSAGATLVVLSPPAITAPPVGQTLPVGTNVTFSVTTSGSGPQFFQWLKDSVPLADGGIVFGATSNILTLVGVNTNDTGNYSVTVTNSLGSATSSNAALLVLLPPAITASPDSQALPVGTNVAFTVTASGSEPLIFQWSKNGVPLANGGNVSGATSNVLTLATLSTNDAGNYSVSVSNAVGSAGSSNAVLTILLPPAIRTHPHNLALSAGSNAAFSVVVTGTAPLVYQWLKDSAPLADGGKISGANSNVLTVAAVNTNDAGVYSVTVSNALGTATSSNALLSILTVPVILTQPQSLYASTGTVAVISVVADSPTPLSYRWLKNGISLTNGVKFSGVSSNVLAIANLTTNDSANFSVAITNVAGSVTSSVAVLSVQVPVAFTLQASNRAVKVGTNTYFRAAVKGTAPYVYQWLKDGVPLADGGNISGSTSNVLRVAVTTTNDGGNYSLSVSNNVNGITSSNAMLTVLVPPTIVVAPTNQSVVVSNSVAFTVEVAGTAPFRYQWKKGTAAIAGATNAVFALTSAKTNDAGSYFVVITNRAGSVTSSVAVLSVQVPVAFTLQASNRAVKVGTNTYFRAAVKGTAPYVYQWLKDGVPLADGGNISGSTSNVLRVAVTTTNDGGNYSLSVSNNVNGITSSNAMLTVLVPPTIVVAPTNQSVVVSNSVAFTVEVAGTAPFRYQWKKGTAAIAGATNAVFALTSAKTNDAGSYFVVITNRAGSVTSSVAVLSVQVPVAFTLQASNRAVKVGTNTYFRAAVKGTAPYVYQWLKDGVPLADGGNISGSTSNVLRVAVTTTNDGGNYSLSVSNNVNGITSSNAMLTVLVPPTIVVAPTNQSVVVSNSVAFTVEVAGTAPFRYQWKKGTAAIAGATNAVFTIAIAKLTDAATNYTVVITNRVGSVTSAPVTLTVLAAAALAPHVVAATVVANPPAVGELTILRHADGSVTVNLAGTALAQTASTAQTNYILQTTDNLAAPNWQTVGNNFSQPDGSWQMTDTNAVSQPVRFYRVVTQP